MTPRKKLTLVASIFITLCIIAIIAAIIYRVNQPANTPSSDRATISTDATTGEQVISVEGQTPENESFEGANILGLTKLNEYGLSSAQITTVKDTLAQYATSVEGTERISIDPKDIKYSLNQETGQTDITTEIVLNQSARQKMIMSYISTTDMLVRLYDINSGAEIFTSADDQH